jgi:formate hydrogenlyase subunit 3/multisubunit Na+/H+ antiporter MnhD subunit
MVSASQVSFGILTIVLVHPTKQTAGLYFLTGIVPAAIIGSIIIDRLQNRPSNVLRDDGLLYPNLVVLLLLATLALSAFPVTQACWGEEMLLGDLWLRMPILTAISIVTLVLNGYTLMQIFAQKCFGRKWLTKQQVS